MYNGNPAPEAARYVNCQYRIFHGTWRVTCNSAIWYSMVRDVSLEIPRSDIPWYVKCHSRFPIGFSTVREVSFEIPVSDISRYVKCHSRFPIGFSTVREVSFEIPLSDISRYVKCHSKFPYWIFHETKVWEGINVSWIGTVYPMHSSPNSLQTPLITMWHKYNNQAQAKNFYWIPLLLHIRMFNSCAQ